MDVIIPIIILLVLFIVIFLALREFNCWYWKVNERNQLLKDISRKLDELNSK